MAYNPNFNPNCGACGGLNSRGYCNYTACRFPHVTSGTVITVNPPIYVDDTPKPITHYDEIRTMSIEELADWLVMNGNGEDYKSWLDWLREEVEK